MVAIAAVLVVLIVAVSLRGRQKRSAERRAEGRSALSVGPVPDKAQVRRSRLREPHTDERGQLKRGRAVTTQFAGSNTFALAAVVLLLGGCGTAEEGKDAASGSATTSAVAAAHPHPAHHPAHRHSRAARHASSPTASALGHQTKFVGCHVRRQLPDPGCTPGAIFAAATVSQICTPGYSRAVRNVPESLKQSVYAEYGIESHVPGSYEVDHLVSLELGGNNSAANLWPEISPGYHEKDGIENRLHDAVCGGSVSLRAAQREIARDWRHTSAGAPTEVRRQVPRSSPVTPRIAPSAGTPANFCTTHQCIASFDEGHGTILQCADGEWSHSGGQPGVCSRHGGPR